MDEGDANKFTTGWQGSAAGKAWTEDVDGTFGRVLTLKTEGRNKNGLNPISM